MNKFVQWRHDPADPLPDERSVGAQVEDLFSSPDEWLDSPHPSLGGRTPRDCLNADEEQPVRDLLRRIKLVPYT